MFISQETNSLEVAAENSKLKNENKTQIELITDKNILINEYEYSIVVKDKLIDEIKKENERLVNEKNNYINFFH
ncbi:hypothetical protein [Candidatus Phytoplasma sp. AldY-WA1]|uniref:hypothetical protein n=1 Tax=Candidatus Phytoplasma sp. AldY-WA1 TaxID=2852100 RepID=UPI00254B2F25|nr:hypothetical protein [Candidatus Phytoplasma sp. AldY-WA1]